MIWVMWVCDTSDMAFCPKGMIWVLSIFERIRLSRYCAAIREHYSCLYRICKKNIFCSKYMIYKINACLLVSDNGVDEIFCR